MMQGLVIQIIRMVGVIAMTFFIAGCQIWPFMSDEDGRRPIAMGKNDQILHPYAAPLYHLSEDYGQSFRTARDSQILYPEASRNLEPVTEIDGRAAQKGIERLRKQYDKPPYELTPSDGGGS